MIPTLDCSAGRSRIGSFSIVFSFWALARSYGAPDIPSLCTSLHADGIFPCSDLNGPDFYHHSLIDALLSIADSLHPVPRRSGLPGLCGVVDLNAVPIWFSIHGDLPDNWYSVEPDWWADASASRLGDLVDDRYDLEALDDARID